MILKLSSFLVNLSFLEAVLKVDVKWIMFSPACGRNHLTSSASPRLVSGLDQCTTDIMIAGTGNLVQVHTELTIVDNQSQCLKFGIQFALSA